ncbi:neuraminidase-like domain-containing protein [Pseudomonas abietaniphila]|uniref:Tc toxin subunit A-related protein n=1 Tax=Pseudomonas abietaniphila TaxID=89065 RepID=UPI0009E37A6C|nr:neuraminidase-like domain-containing protein [Pseudomonas abietaniphila]
MSSAIESQLNESFRDALVGYYLSEVVPNHTPIQEMGLSDMLKTANDLFEFLLLDVQVAQRVDTSYVASAISSLQQYVNAVLMGMEPGYSSQVLNANQLSEWRDQRSQYPIWAANQKLLYYPELYIDPTLRLAKSGYFQQLETDINQNKIEVDTVQEAVKAYLASFEEVANLSIINGYIDSNDFATGTYYFIGKSRAEQQYYWRSVNMNDRAYLSGMDGPKSDYPNPGAWSDWKKANIGITPHTLENTIRPVYFNNRLFVTWVDRSEVEQTEASGSGGNLVVNAAPKVKLVMNAAYKKYDDSWSAPHAYIEEMVEATQLKDDMGSIAVFDNSHSPEGLFLAIYASGNQGEYDFWRMCLVDKNFNSRILENDPPTEPIKVVRDIFSLVNANAVQFQVDAALNVSLVEKYETPSDSAIDFLGYKSAVNDSTLSSVKYDSARGEIEFTMGTKPVPIIGEKFDFELQFFHGPFIVYIEFVVCLTRSPEQDWCELDERSYIKKIINGDSLDDRPFDMCWDIFRPVETSFFLWDYEGYPGPLSAHEGASFKGRRLNLEYFRHGPSYSSLVAVIGAATCLTLSSRVLERTALRMVLGFSSEPEKLTDSNIDIADRSMPLSVIVDLKRSIKIRINTQTGLPYSGYVSSAGMFHVLYGVEFEDEDGLVVGRALNCVKIELAAAPPSVDHYKSPRILLSAENGFGIAEYIDFTGSTIEYSDEGTTSKRKPIRMNTLFARELINKANLALENLLSWETQQLKEPPLGTEMAPPMDFHGANGLYFWELFFHLPLMVAQRLNLERQFDGSDQWLGFIFDPSREADPTGRPDYWNVRPLEEASVRDYAMRRPIDPDGLASSNPVIYKKATYGYYIKNLLDRGDAAYRQLTPDSLTEAKLWYVRVLDLLGPRPDTLLINDWTPVTLDELHGATNTELRTYEQTLIEQDERYHASAAANPGYAQIGFREPPLCLSTFAVDPMLAEVDNPHFRVPLNAELVRHWDVAESRLYNLRHNLTLDGKPMNLPLFAAPLDPRAMLSAFANGNAGGGLGNLLGQDVGHYRFAVMHGHASAAVETLIQFGSNVLSMIERKEMNELQEVQQHQAWEFAQFAIELQEQTQKLESESRQALLASQKIVDQRAVYYYQLADEGVSAGERAASASHSLARALEGVTAISRGLAVGAQAAEFIVGFSNGDFKALRVPAQMAATFGDSAAEVATLTSEILERSEMYRRRQEEWEHSRDQARLESEQIDAQLKVFDEQVRLTAIQLRQAKIAYEQARINYEFLSRRFTQSQLYQWITGQLSSFYYQAYDATLSLCLAAEACWQFERADFGTRFIRPSAWNDTYRGLMAGESLKLDLLKMNAAYLMRNERLLEIVKTVSVRQLPASTDEEPTLNKGWDEVVKRLEEEGVVEFEITRAMLDDDYPGHYLRRIKRISVSLPVTVGPYQDIRAVLTQTYNAVHLTAGAEVAPRENLRASQQIAVSTGVDDDGLFVFNFDDERYLPFEGTGVVSRWTLAFPNPESQRDMLDSITDIIVHIRYTARSSGSPLSRTVPVAKKLRGKKI